MEEYAKSLKMIEVRKGSPGEILTDVEMKVYRKYSGKLTLLTSVKLACKLIANSIESKMNQIGEIKTGMAG